MRNLLTLGERDIVLYRSNRSTLPTDELADFPVETDLRAALAHKPDAVIISNPTALHLDVAIPAAESGAHLLIEKPIAHSLHHIPDLENGSAPWRRTGVGRLPVPLASHAAAAQQLLAEGAIGSVVSARAPMGRVPARLAPVGGLPQELLSPAGIRRRRGVDAVSPLRLPALVAG